MTTAVSAPPPVDVGPLREATGLLALVTLLLAPVAGATDGATGVRAVLVAAAVVTTFFVFGAVSTGVASAYAPGTALFVALTTYTTQVVVLPMVFLALQRSGTVPEQLHRGWLAAAVVACTLAWSFGLVLHALRSVPGAGAGHLQQRTAGET
jgi:hypothetical protein